MSEDSFSTESPSLLIVANWDWVIYNFRLALARSARADGCDVTFVCPDGKYVADLQAEGFRCIEWSLDRKSLNPITEGHGRGLASCARSDL